MSSNSGAENYGGPSKNIYQINQNNNQMGFDDQSEQMDNEVDIEVNSDNELDILNISNQLTINENFIQELKSGEKIFKSNAKILKLSNQTFVEGFQTFINGGEFKLQNFPNLFMLQIKLDAFDDILLDNFLMRIKETFPDRPIIIDAIIENSGRKLFIKNPDDFIEFEKIQDVPYVLNFKELINTIKSNDFHLDEYFQGSLIRSDILCMRYMMIFNEIQNLSFELAIQSIQMGNLEIFAAIQSTQMEIDLEMFKATLDIPFTLYDYRIDARISAILTKISNKNQSIFKAAVENNSNNIISFIVGNFSSTFASIPFAHKLEIINIAFNSGNSILLTILLYFDFPIPKNFQISNFNDENLNKIVTAMARFKTAIDNGNKEYIIAFQNGYHYIKHGFILQQSTNLQQSAVYYSILNKNFQMYTFLKSLGFTASDHENINDIIDKLDEAELTEIHIGNLNHAIKDESKIPNILKSKSHLHNNGMYKDFQTTMEHFARILRAYSEIYQFDIFKKIFTIAADSEDFEMYYDFNSNGIYDILPPEKDCEGICLPSYVFIGAKCDDLSLKLNIIHELFHFANNTIFENKYLPYYENDINAEQEYKGIIEECSKIKHRNDVIGIRIARVYNEKAYSVDERGKELIVHVLEIFLYSHGNQQLQNEYKALYGNLINFYNNRVDPAFKSSNIQQRIHVRNFNSFSQSFAAINSPNIKLNNNKINIQGANYVITTNSSFLTLVDISQKLQQTQFNGFSGKNLFINTKMFKNKEIVKQYRNLTEKYKDLNVFVDCSDEFDEILFQELYRDFFDSFTIIASSKTSQQIMNHIRFDHLTHKLENFIPKNINYSWKDLTNETQLEMLQNCIINFQGNDLHLWKLLSKCENCSNSENFEEFQKYYIQIPRYDQISSIFDVDFINSILRNEKVSVNLDSCSLSDFYLMRLLEYKYEYETKVKMSKMEYENWLQNPGDVKYRINNEKTKINGDENVVNVIKTELKTQTQTEGNLLKNAEGKRIILLSDIAGAGKTTTILNIGRFLKEKHPNYWVLYVNLRIYLNSFINHENEVKNFSKFICDYILTSKTVVEKKIFIEMCKIGKTFIILDGLDEILPKCNNSALKFIKSINNDSTANQIWIITRNRLEDKLKKELMLKTESIYSIKPFDEIEKNDFFKRCLWSLNKTSNVEEIEKIAAVLMKKLNKICKESIGVPLVLKILSRCSFDNQSNIESITLYKIYNQSIRYFTIRFQNDKGQLATSTSITSQDENPSFWDINRYLAMKSYYLEQKSFFGLKRNERLWTKDEIDRAGIAKIDENETITFIHETYKEHFAASYMLLNLEDGSVCENFCENFLKFLHNKEHGVIRQFMDEGLPDVEESLFNNCQKFANDISKILKLKNFNVLEEIVDEVCKNLFKFILAITKHFDKDLKSKLINKSVLLISMNGNRFEMFKKIIDEYQHLHALNSLIECQTLHVLRSLIDGEHLLHYATNSFVSFEVLQNLLAKIKQMKLNEKFLCQKDIIRRNVLFMQALKDNEKKFEIILKFMEENLPKPTFIQEITSLSVVGTIFHALSVSNNEKMLRIFWTKLREYEPLNPAVNIKDMMKQEIREYYGKNILHTIIRNGNFNIKFHDTFWEIIQDTFYQIEIKNLVLQPDRNENNFLHDLVNFGRSEIIENSLESLKKILPSEEFKEILKVKGFNHRNLLQKAADKSTDVDARKTLWKFMRNEFGDAKFLSMIKEKDKDGDNVLFTAIAFSTRNVVEFMTQEIELVHEALYKDDDDEKFKEFLRKRGFRGQNILQRAASFNKSKEVHEYIWNFVLENFGKSKVDEMIREGENYGSNLFHVAVSYNTLEVCQTIWKNIAKLLKTRTKIQEYLQICGFRGLNYYQNSRQKNTSDVYDWVLELMEIYDVLV